MSVPGEDYVLRLRWTDPHALTSRILDVVSAPDDEVVALVAWEAMAEGMFVQAGFSVIRFTSTGYIRWQSTHTLCGGGGTDCGEWMLLYGAITTDDNKRFIAMTTAVKFDKPGVFASVGIGVDDGGAVAWCQSYATTYSIGRAIGIAPLTKPGHFLVASHNHDETETWLYGIDRNGALTKLEMRFFNKFVQRFRAVPTQGLFVLGTNNDDASNPLGWILNVDPTTEKPAWERTYDPGDDTTLRWYDAAKGTDVVTVVGNCGTIAAPFLATLADNTAPDVGNVRTSFRPQAGDANIVLNGIAHFPTPASTTSICGAFDGAAWHLAIDDAINVLWQKQYSHGASGGALTPILFPNDHAIVAGGVATVGGNPPRGLLVQSHVVADPAPFHCGDPTNAIFEPADLTSEAIHSKYKELAIKILPFSVNQAPLLELDQECLP